MVDNSIESFSSTRKKLTVQVPPTNVNSVIMSHVRASNNDRHLLQTLVL